MSTPLPPSICHPAAHTLQILHVQLVALYMEIIFNRDMCGAVCWLNMVWQAEATGKLIPSTTSSLSNSKLFGASFFGAGTCGKIQSWHRWHEKYCQLAGSALFSFCWPDKGLEFRLETSDDRGDGSLVLIFHENNCSWNAISDYLYALICHKFYLLPYFHIVFHNFPYMSNMFQDIGAIRPQVTAHLRPLTLRHFSHSSAGRPWSQQIVHPVRSSGAGSWHSSSQRDEKWIEMMRT